MGELKVSFLRLKRFEEIDFESWTDRSDRLLATEVSACLQLSLKVRVAWELTELTLI